MQLLPCFPQRLDNDAGPGTRGEEDERPDDHDAQDAGTRGERLKRVDGRVFLGIEGQIDLIVKTRPLDALSVVAGD